MIPEKLTVLLIEDDEDDYVLTCDLLKETKRITYEITWISRYHEAEAATRLGGFDVCLVDYRLGEGDGITLIRDAIAHGCQMPMILLTGQGDPDVDLSANAAGAVDYLVKGEIDAQLLERSIRYAVAKAKVTASLAESEMRFRSVIESATDGIVLTDAEGRIISWNPGAETIFGYSQGAILGMPISTIFVSDNTDIHSTFTETNSLASAVSLQPGKTAVEIRGLRSDDSEVPLEISVSSWQTPAGICYSGIIRDITERKALEHQLTHQTLHDPLTKLPNRVLFKDRVEHAITRAERRRVQIAVLFLDLDNFKTINDTMGHSAGDSLLIAVADRLQACLRTSDTASRLGGDEFAVLIEDTTGSNGGGLVAQRILDTIRQPIDIGGKDVFIGASIGIAVSSPLAGAPATLLRNADLAMYMAKSRGKNQYAVFEDEMHNAQIKSAKLETELRTALSGDEFEMVYQPIVELDSNRIVGVEALVRWNHPGGIMVSASEFIPIAEKANLMVELGQWILDQACTQCAHWHTEFGELRPLSVAVNVSGRQFQDDGFIKSVALATENSQLAPHELILEITEATMLQDTETTVSRLKQLRNVGVRVALDHFGTGYSSLSYLHKFPIDVLKIAKSFIDKIDDGEEGSAMARAIISMSETLHISTIAEGVEKPEQISVLKSLGCEMGQGYAFARPMAAKEMSRFLRDASEWSSVPPPAASKPAKLPAYHF